MDAEAVAILAISQAYTGSPREHQTMTSAKRWTSLLAAYSGARIGELVQLRVEDVRQDSGIDYIRIAPDAGTVKSGRYRDEPSASSRRGWMKANSAGVRHPSFECGRI